MEESTEAILGAGKLGEASLAGDIFWIGIGAVGVALVCLAWNYLKDRLG